MSQALYGRDCMLSLHFLKWENPQGRVKASKWSFRKMPVSFHSNDLHIRFYQLGSDHNNQLKAESQVLESLHESCLTQDICVKIPGVPEQMSGAGEVHCPHEVPPSLAAVEDVDEISDQAGALQAATSCHVRMWSHPEAGGLGSVRFMLDSVILELHPRGFYESTSWNHLNLLFVQAEMNLVTGLGPTLRANCTGVQTSPRKWKSPSEGPPEYRHLPFQILWQWHIFQLLFSVNSQLITLVIYNSSVNSCFWICAMAQRAVIRCSLARVCASSISGCCLATAGNGEFSQWGLKLYTEI